MIKVAPLYRSISKMGHRTAFVAFVEGTIVSASLFLALLLTSGSRLVMGEPLFVSLSILLFVRLALLSRFNLMRGWWRYTGVNEVVDVIKAVTLGSILIALISKVLLGPASLSVRVMIIEAMGTTLFLLAGRMVSRLFADRLLEENEPSRLVIVIGAGRGAEMLIREMNRAGSGYYAIACLDDDVTKVGISICGAKVEGSPEDLPSLLGRYAIDEVWIAVPSATGAQMSRFVAICDAAHVSYKTLPSLRDMSQDRDVLQQVRQVNLDDLLGREPVLVNLDIVREQIEGRSVMVTGAAGSIGTELCAQLLQYDPASLICVDQNENGMFFLQLAHKPYRNSDKVVYCVADVCNNARMTALFREYRPQLVFHAASYKHVPMMEVNVQEAVQNNVFSLLELLGLAEVTGCESFVMISSDKAVNPTSVMGTTKRICELILASRPSGGMRCVSVRFGNVLGSNGSVVPVLQEQILRDADITITHPEIRRYFMTIHEAVSLVLQAFTVGEHGDLLVLDMGQSIRILDLAHRLIRLNGKSAEKAKIKIIGLREGEKLVEEMFYEHEDRFPTVCEKIIKTRGKLRGWERLEPMLQSLREAIEGDYVDSMQSASYIRCKMKEIVPEYDFPMTRMNLVTPISNGHSSAGTMIKEQRAAVGSGNRSNIRK